MITDVRDPQFNPKKAIQSFHGMTTRHSAPLIMRGDWVVIPDCDGQSYDIYMAVRRWLYSIKVHISNHQEESDQVWLLTALFEECDFIRRVPSDRSKFVFTIYGVKIANQR